MHETVNFTVPVIYLIYPGTVIGALLLFSTIVIIVRKKREKKRIKREEEDKRWSEEHKKSVQREEEKRIDLEKDLGEFWWQTYLSLENLERPERIRYLYSLRYRIADAPSLSVEGIRTFEKLLDGDYGVSKALKERREEVMDALVSSSQLTNTIRNRYQ